MISIHNENLFQFKMWTASGVNGEVGQAALFSSPARGEGSGKGDKVTFLGRGDKVINF